MDLDVFFDLTSVTRWQVIDDSWAHLTCTFLLHSTPYMHNEDTTAFSMRIRLTSHWGVEQPFTPAVSCWVVDRGKNNLYLAVAVLWKSSATSYSDSNDRNPLHVLSDLQFTERLMI